MSYELLEVPIIKNGDELKTHLRDIYIINDYMASDEDYGIFQEKMYSIIKGCIEHKDCREYPIKFKFYREDKDTHILEFRHFIVNMFLWFPYVELYGFKALTSRNIIDCNKQVNAHKFSDFINDVVIDTVQEYNIKNTSINYHISEALYNLRRISIDFSLIMGLTMNAELFIDMYERYPRMQEIMTTQFSDEMQPSDVEEELHKLMNEEIEIFKKDNSNAIGVILNAGTGIKDKQLSEFTINGGFKPSLDGKTIPIVINSNTMIGGLNKVSSLYIDALGARKSLIMNKRIMGKAGHFGKIVTMLSRTLSLSKTVSDCDSKHGVTIYITNGKVLNKLNGRFYKRDNNEDYRLLNSKEDVHLIGKYIILRSPVTCSLGDEVCQKCYGMTATINYDIADGVASFGSQEITKVVNQMILSAKHLLTTISEKIGFNDEFYNFFTIIAGEINPRISGNDDVDGNLDDYCIIIKDEDLEKNNDMDDDGSYNTFIKTGRFYIKNKVTKQEIIIQSNNNKEIYLSDECIKLMKKGKIKFSDLDDNIPLFMMEISNNELTKPLYNIMNLLNKQREKGQEDTIDSICQQMIELLIESGISAMGVQGELIINRLIRGVTPDTKYYRPDFTKYEMPAYNIVTVTQALENNKSPIIGMSFQEIRRQLMSNELFDSKTSSSYLDPLFKKKIKLNKLNSYRRK